jgi:hypothetical protein
VSGLDLLAVLRRVDAGDFHCATRASLPSESRPLADQLARLGFLAVLPRKGRWPKRFVLTNRGVWASGALAFASNEAFDREVRAAKSRASRASSFA